MDDETKTPSLEEVLLQMTSTMVEMNNKLSSLQQSVEAKPAEAETEPRKAVIKKVPPQTPPLPEPRTSDIDSPSSVETRIESSGHRDGIEVMRIK